jgi:hypothetical protein
MLDRGAALKQYEFGWPTIDAAFAVGAMRALMLALIVVAAAWGLYALYRRLLGGARPESRPAPSDRVEMTP